MRKLLVHIGYPKTATKSLQFNLLTQLMHDNKIEYLNHLDKEREDIGDIHCNKTLSAIIGLNSSADYKSEIEGFKKIKKQLTVLSNESLAHVSKASPMASYTKATTENAKNIKNLLSPHFDSTEILMTIRAQETIIPSYYTQEYNNIVADAPEFDDIGIWLKSNFGENMETRDLLFNYNEMFRAYSNVFGENNVNVLIFEDLKNDKLYYYQQLGKIFDLEVSSVKKYFETTKYNVTSKSKNGGTEASRMSFHQLANSKINQLFKNHRNKGWFQKTKYIIKNLSPNSNMGGIKIGRGTKIRELSENEVILIHKRFDQSNFELFEKLNLDHNKLASYNYYN